MPVACRPMPADTPALRRDGDALVFTGALLREHVRALWRDAVAQAAGARRFDLTAVTGLDSAGLALLTGVAARAGGTVEVAGDPPGLAALRDAYRLTPALGFVRA